MGVQAGDDGQTGCGRWGARSQMTSMFGRVCVRACVALAGLTMTLGAVAPTVRASVVTESAIPTASSQSRGIAAGPDGALWFTERSGDNIGRITTGGTITEFALATANSQPVEIAAGSDGALWFIELVTNKIGRITLDVGPAGPDGQQGTAGTQGPAGQQGTAGTQGTAGQAGADGSDRFILAVAFGQSPYRVRRGRSLTMRYVCTHAADVTVEIRKGTRVVKRRLATAHAGRNSLTIRDLPHGTFTLRLQAFITGQTSTDTAHLTVTP